jgi:hypothetical protein
MSSEAGDTTGSCDLVLTHLVELWLWCDVADPGAILLERAIPSLCDSRARLGQKPITLIEISAASWGEWLLRAARQTTSLVERFGCDRLIRLVRKAFPRDVPADPWQISSVVAVWRSRLMAEHPELAALVHTASAGYIRSEFNRRLMTWGRVDEALEAVDFDALCEWVRQAFGGINFFEMQLALEMEFSTAREAFPRPPRLTVDPETNVITLDGVGHKTNPHGVAVIKALLDAQADGKLPAATRDIRTRIPGCNHDTAFRRWKDALPDAVRECIKHKDGVGIYLELPPL